MIKVIPNILSNEECDQILFDLDPIKNSIATNYPGVDNGNLKKIEPIFHKLVNSAVERCGIDRKLKSCALVYYPTGSRNQRHADNSYVTVKDGVRTVVHTNDWTHTGIIFLNDNFDGGVLSYPDQGCALYPTVGTMVIAPADLEYTHLVSDVISGDRFVLVFRFI